ncbi:HvfC/BufC family peptide modification chaperone [Ideonella sp. BN130291]|uniref:HvfC/BufC family peptide modification chaperone n=1 Tax=Ideonella sp. BN130291 TaxID=3112940 RepID=UPI002E26AFC9|nr:putative DNA-binding domain-containing protein [Ideonella sp. BN130291]
MSDDALEREHRRQQALLQALWQPQARAQQALAGWLREPDAALTGRGLRAYAANAGASAERALAASFPTVRALVGEEAFAGLARARWRALPPERGDLACFGASLPGFIEADPQLADVPYLGDSARLDALLAQAEAAADVPAEPHSFTLLADTDPAGLRLRLAPGFALLRSRYPVVQVWQAHQGTEPEAVEAARAALAEGQADNALVWRQGWKARVQAIDDAQARWCDALLAGRSLADALTRAGDAFAFEPWLLQALQCAWVLGVQPL